MKKIQILVAQFDSRIQKETESAKQRFYGNLMKLSMFKERLQDIENQKKSAVEGTEKILKFLRETKLFNVRVKGKNITQEQVVFENLKIQFSSFEAVIKAKLRDLVQV